MSKRHNIVLATFVLAGMALGGCVQLPTEKAGVVDLRPRLSFRVSTDEPGVQAARVHVNGLDVGTVAEYLQGQAVLRVLPGNNAIKVVAGSHTLFDQQVYLGDGVERTIVLK